MIKLIITNLSVFMCILFGYAHDADEAYFEITTQKYHTIIEAEFPWTIRNALIAYDSNFSNAKTIEDINVIFFNYVKEKFKIFDSNDNPLALQKVKLIKDKNHSHSTNYTIIFKGTEIAKISNSMLLEYNNSQENHHFYSLNNKLKGEAITDILSPSFNIKSKQKSTQNIYLIISVSILTAIIGFYLFLRIKKSSSNGSKGSI
ncbi:hypothetical protein [Flavivirga jejuensis]|uniref:Uncharacterized protein n=1 Tax=Flavivirga jejuensis TaxID=870487 RepID=A0ABT8WUM5_9FLAO|nr:hypothetical protein [Flavivirga jejuensis]MDO5976875.1 hypothetical protein [Flavivirga jejuensis]